jgi:hypothetical protein
MSGKIKLVYVINPTRIADSYGNPLTSTNTALNVNVVNNPNNNQTINTPISFFGEITNVPASVSTEILSYIIPVGEVFDLIRIYYSGDNIAQFDVLLNGNLIGRSRTYFGGNLNGTIEFGDFLDAGLKCVANDVISVVATHFRPSLGSFEARIEGIVQDNNPPVTQLVNYFNDISSVPSNTLTTILTYIVPNTITKGYLIRADYSGSNIAKYTTTLNSHIISLARTYFGGDLNYTDEFDTANGLGVLVNQGDVIQVQVIHSRPFPGDFEARIEVSLSS